MAEMNPGTIFPPVQPEYSLSGEALRGEQIEEGGVGTAPPPAEGMQRYPTEAPPAHARAWAPSLRWTAIGGLAGAVGAALWMRTRGRARLVSLSGGESGARGGGLDDQEREQ